MSAIAVQGAIREFFRGWGVPQRLRVDNGYPWGKQVDLPSGLALWLMGVGVTVIWNRPHHPQENAKVERQHGLVDQWVEPSQCQDGVELVRKLAWAAQIQRERYPAINGQTRAQAYPQLLDGGREYGREQERQWWDIGRVRRHLAQGVWVRRVNKCGQITMYNRGYTVGREHAYRNVAVLFDPDSNQWVVRSDRGEEWVRHAAVEIDQESILLLDVGYIKPHRRVRWRCDSWLIADRA